jgi:hypothetical protein
MEQASIRLQLVDGTVVDSSFTPPFSIAEQVHFEENFKVPFLAVDSGFDELRKAAVKASGGEDEGVDTTGIVRTTWILWFAWRRARPQVPPKFSLFLDQLKDWSFLGAADAESKETPTEEPEAGSPDPTAQDPLPGS